MGPLRTCRLGHREVVSLRFGAGLLGAETSAVTGKSLGAVRMLQHQALSRLKRILETSGGEQESAFVTTKAQPTIRSD